MNKIKQSISTMQTIYNTNKLSKIGSECVCPSCSTKFIKGSYQQAFCKSKTKTQCKDKYYNTIDPNKRNNTTRISPASKEYLQNKAVQYGFPDHETRKNHVDDFDGSWDAHGCNVGPCPYCKMRTEYCDCDY